MKEAVYDVEETDSALEASILGENEALELLKDVSNSIVTGFQLATASGYFGGKIKIDSKKDRYVKNQ